MKCRNIEIDSKVELKIKMKYYVTYFSGCLIFVLLLVGCGAKLGTIQVEDVNTLIQQADKAINSALEVNAQTLAFEEFEKAETELEKAKDALSKDKGLEALKYANFAIAHAQIAKQEALQNTINAETNASILAKDAELVQQRKNISDQNTKISNLKNGLQQHQDTEKGLNRRITTLENENREMNNKNRIHINEVTELNKSLKSLQARITRLETDVRNYGNQAKDMKRKLDAADSIAKSESRQKRAAIAEAESLKRQMREQAKNYSAKLAEVQKRNVATEHAEFLRKQAEEARAYVRQLDSNKPVRTGRTSLSTQQINAGKSVLRSWDRAWNSNNIQAHLDFYIPNVTVNKISVIESKENQTAINRTQFESDLRQMMTQAWQKTEESTEVEQESVIGTYRLSRLVTPAETEDDTALYQLWIREIWVHQVQGKWKIYRETWQVYDNIPKL